MYQCIKLPEQLIVFKIHGIEIRNKDGDVIEKVPYDIKAQYAASTITHKYELDTVDLTFTMNLIPNIFSVKLENCKTEIGSVALIIGTIDSTDSSSGIKEVVFDSVASSVESTDVELEPSNRDDFVEFMYKVEFDEGTRPADVYYGLASTYTDKGCCLSFYIKDDVWWVKGVMHKSLQETTFSIMYKNSVVEAESKCDIHIDLVNKRTSVLYHPFKVSTTLKLCGHLDKMFRIVEVGGESIDRIQTVTSFQDENLAKCSLQHNGNRYKVIFNIASNEVLVTQMFYSKPVTDLVIGYHLIPDTGTRYNDVKFDLGGVCLA